MSTSLLLGREPEVTKVRSLLDPLQAGGCALVIEGEAGVGKTALLDEAARIARDLGVAVLRTAGVPSEIEMPFAGLHRLLRPHLAGIDRLPAPQRDALASAFGLGAATGADAFLIALAALDLLAEAAAQTPLLLIIDDARWLDPDSTEVLAFVARRIELEPIVMLFGVRNAGGSRIEAAALPSLHLRPLREADAASLLDLSAPDLPPEIRRSILEAAAGNPLALIELPRAEGRGTPDAVASLTPLPITDRLERAFSERLPDLPPRTRDLLLVAALDEGGGLPEQLEAATVVAGRPVRVADVARAEEVGLITLDGGVAFRHPLVRAAVVSAASISARRAAHAALAEAYPDDFERRVWHRAASAGAPDVEISLALEEAASRARRRGALAVSASALQRAAELSIDASRQGSLLVQAADLQFDLGRSEAALELVRVARLLPLPQGDRSRVMYLLEASDNDSWSGAARVAASARVAAQIDGSAQPELAMRALLAAAVGCWWGNPVQDTRDAVVTAAERLPVPDDSPGRLAILACADPVRRGALVVERIRDRDPSAAISAIDSHLIGTAATAVFAFDLSMSYLAVAIDGLRAEGRVRLLAQALVSQAWAALHLAKASLATSAADEAARLCRETGQMRWAVAADLVRATVAGERGDVATLETMTRQAEAELLALGAHGMLALVQFARGRAAVAHQRYEEGYDHLRRVLDPTDIAFHPFVAAWGLSDLVEASAHTGRPEEAQRYLEALEELAVHTTGSFAEATLSYARPLLAADDQAEALYLAALDAGLTHWPCYRGRLLLNYGRWLRRHRRVSESRAPLRAARESFDALGFVALADSARQELRASGESSRSRTPDAVERLTPQELQIAQMAVAGLSNREIGQRLYLSHRTVESHLYRIYPKLGISSRAQLRSVLPGEVRGVRQDDGHAEAVRA